MNGFRLLLVGLFLIMLVYTIFTVIGHGWLSILIFFKDIMVVDWSGQFNLDFSSYLTIAFLWMSWRQKFAVAPTILLLIATLLGMVFFAPYVLYLTFQAKGDMKKVLLGQWAS